MEMDPRQVGKLEDRVYELETERRRLLDRIAGLERQLKVLEDELSGAMAEIMDAARYLDTLNRPILADVMRLRADSIGKAALAAKPPDAV